MAAILKIQDTYLDPITTNIYDLGTLTEQFKDLYIDGLAYIDGIGESTTLSEAVNIVLGTTTGTKIGTATTQKLGFFNATPIVQVGATIDLGVVLSNLGLRAVGTAYPITTSGAVTLTGITTVNSGIVLTDNNVFCYEGDVLTYEEEVVYA